jgi:hypothetical protein
MSLFAGVFALAPQARLPEGLERRTAALSRDPADRPRRWQGPRHHLAFVDLGLLGGEGMLEDGPARGAVLCGEALLPGPSSRDADLAALYRDWQDGGHALADRAHGTWSALLFDMGAGRVRLHTDALGLRPVFHAWIDGCLYAASTLRLLRALLPEGAATWDDTALAQLSSLQHTLEDRTAWSAVRALRGGECLDVDAQGPVARTVTAWDRSCRPAADAPFDEDAFAAALHEAFTAAVRRRLAGERHVAAHLSGGLDSRLVVASLRALGQEVDTLNYAPPGSADLVLGREVAQALGTRHHELPEGVPDFWDRMVASHRDWRAGVAPRPPRPGRLWTGFAGETVLAPTGMTAALIDHRRAGRRAPARDAYLERAGARLPERLFVARRRAALREALHASVDAAIDRHDCPDPAQAPHLEQLLNEVRANQARHHEDLDLRRIELVSPFCDRAFVALALQAPPERLLRHRFYYRWLSRFPAAVGQLPWQSYPWSEPCPLPLPPALRLQWSEGWHDASVLREHRQGLRRGVRALLRRPGTRPDLLDHRHLRLACWLVGLGIERPAYLLGPAHALLSLLAEPAPTEP